MLFNIIFIPSNKNVFQDHGFVHRPIPKTDDCKIIQNCQYGTIQIIQNYPNTDDVL